MRGKFQRLALGLFFLPLLTGCPKNFQTPDLEGIPFIAPTPTPLPTMTPTPTPTTGATVKPSPTPAPTTSPVDTSSAAHWFAPTLFFNEPIDTAPVDHQSDTIISNLVARGGWGNSNRFQIDFSIDVHYTSNPTTYLPFKDLGVYQPDSDHPAQVPVPKSGAAGFESSTGTTCDGGDCHYLAVDVATKQLFEGFQTSVAGGFFQSSGIIVVWDTTKSYPANLRGDVCTSADAGGFPIAPLLFTAEEVAKGEINHAIRFILPNSRIQYREYVRPASHGTGSTGWATTNGVPYGARFRLKASYNVNALPTKGARVVARALQRYGMILADGGNIALTAKSDKSSTQKWAGLLGATDLRALTPGDFEMVDAGTRIDFGAFDCVRNP